MLPNTIVKAQKKILEIERQHCIESLKDNHNNYKSIERRIKRGELGLSNEYSKPQYLLYRSYLKACDKTKKYFEKNNIVQTDKDPSPTTVISVQSSIKSNKSNDLSSISRRLFIGGDCESLFVFDCLCVLLLTYLIVC